MPSSIHLDSGNSHNNLTISWAAPDQDDIPGVLRSYSFYIMPIYQPEDFHIFIPDESPNVGRKRRQVQSIYNQNIILRRY